MKKAGHLFEGPACFWAHDLANGFSLSATGSLTLSSTSAPACREIIFRWQGAAQRPRGSCTPHDYLARQASPNEGEQLAMPDPKKTPTRAETLRAWITTLTPIAVALITAATAVIVR